MPREPREQHREDCRELGPGGADTRYPMRLGVLSIGHHGWIANERGERARRAGGEARRLRQTLLFEDAAGDERWGIPEQALRVKDRAAAESADGAGRDEVAAVSRPWGRLADTCCVPTGQGQRDAEILPLTVAIDVLAHSDR